MMTEYVYKQLFKKADKLVASWMSSKITFDKLVKELKKIDNKLNENHPTL